MSTATSKKIDYELLQDKPEDKLKTIHSIEEKCNEILIKIRKRKANKNKKK